MQDGQHKSVASPNGSTSLWFNNHFQFPVHAHPHQPSHRTYIRQLLPLSYEHEAITAALAILDFSNLPVAPVCFYWRSWAFASSNLGGRNQGSIDRKT